MFHVPSVFHSCTPVFLPPFLSQPRYEHARRFFHKAAWAELPGSVWGAGPCFHHPPVVITFKLNALNASVLFGTAMNINISYNKGY